MLKVRDVSLRGPGGQLLLTNITLEVNPGELVVVLGNNGAGKTELLETISALRTPSEGTIEFLDRPIQGLSPHEVVNRGLIHVPEGRRIFADQTVYDNLLLGAFSRFRRESPKAIQDRAQQLLEQFPIIGRHRHRIAGALSGGEQQMLAIARSLMAQPRLLLLDEPSTGLAPMVVAQTFDTIQAIKAQGVSVLLVEQVALALVYADRGYLLENGRVRMEGPAADLRRAAEAIYLGNGEE